MDDDKLKDSINRLKSDLEIDEVKATNLINDAVILVS